MRAALYVGLALASAGHAEAQSVATDAVRSREVASGVTLFSSQRGNLVLRTGSGASFVAGSHYPELVDAVVAWLEKHARRPVGFAFIGAAPGAATYGDGGWTARGATTIAHEAFRYRMGAALSHQHGEARPLQSHVPILGFSEVVQLALADEEIHIVHQPVAYGGADALAHFEGSSVFYFGTLYFTDGYPEFDLADGGSAAGMIRVIATLLSMFEANTRNVFVPLRGEPSASARLREYHEMLVSVERRIRDLRTSGRSEAEVIAARPTSEFDTKWGQGPVSPARFVSMVYRGLARR